VEADSEQDRKQIVASDRERGGAGGGREADE